MKLSYEVTERRECEVSGAYWGVWYRERDEVLRAHPDDYCWCFLALLPDERTAAGFIETRLAGGNGRFIYRKLRVELPS